MLCSADSTRRNPTRRSMAANRAAICRPTTTPRASATKPGRLKRTCPSTTRWSMTRSSLSIKHARRKTGASYGSISGWRSRRRTLDPELTILGGRDFVGLVGRLCREQNWEALTSLFGAVGASEQEVAYVSLTDLDTATKVLADALAGSPAPGTRRQADPVQAGGRRRGGRAGGGPHRGRGGAGGAQQPAPPHRARTAGTRPRRARCWGRRATTGARRWCTRTSATSRARHTRGARWATSTGWRRRLTRDEQRSNVRRVAADAVRRFEALLTGGRAPRRARRGRRVDEGRRARRPRP